MKCRLKVMQSKKYCLCSNVCKSSRYVCRCCVVGLLGCCLLVCLHICIIYILLIFHSYAVSSAANCGGQRAPCSLTSRTVSSYFFGFWAATKHQIELRNWKPSKRCTCWQSRRLRFPGYWIRCALIYLSAMQMGNKWIYPNIVCSF